MADAAKGTTNLIAFVVIVVEHFCILGEIADVLRAVHVEYS
jgi:hypothetical protein